MAGDSTQFPGFDATAVRNGLRTAFTVGMPPNTADQATFFKRGTVTTSARPVDQEGISFNADPVHRREHPMLPGIQVKCAVEYMDGTGKIENFGVIVPSKIVITLLDEEHALVEGFEYVVIRGQRFFYRSTEAAAGLISVGVFKVHCYAEDEG